mmetsp:Transcript_14516/g.39945  ORF Transcript_14516/g.39945 Transcript_14516/m.39945 type:complete len:237 (-) Transcript_14516:236-946(-)
MKRICIGSCRVREMDVPEAHRAFDPLQYVPLMETHGRLSIEYRAQAFYCRTRTCKCGEGLRQHAQTNHSPYHSEERGQHRSAIKASVKKVPVQDVFCVAATPHVVHNEYPAEPESQAIEAIHHCEEETHRKPISNANFNSLPLGGEQMGSVTSGLIALRTKSGHGTNRGQHRLRNPAGGSISLLLGSSESFKTSPGQGDGAHDQWQTRAQNKGEPPTSRECDDKSSCGGENPDNEL